MGDSGLLLSDVSLSNDIAKIKSVVVAIRQCLHGAALLVAEDLNVNLVAPYRGRHEEDITVIISTEGLDDLYAHLLPCHKYWAQDRRTWCMHCCRWDVRYQTYYLLGTDRCLFQNVFVQDPRHNYDYYMFLGCICGAPLQEYSHYLGQLQRFSLHQLQTQAQ